LQSAGPSEVADSPAEVAERSSIILTMLPGPPEVREVVAGERGLLEGAGEGSLVVDMSASSPALTRDLFLVARQRGVGMLDAPVSGGDVGAIEGTLSIMVGGSEADFERAKPLFDVMGKTVTHVGPTGAGQVTKAANQIVVALTIEAVSEALVLGGRQGRVPPQGPRHSARGRPRVRHRPPSDGRRGPDVQGANGQGMGGWDHSSLLTLLEEWSGRPES
jgi:2-hydroxy-3-oxopropionate reductase